MVLEFCIRTFQMVTKERTCDKWYWWGGSLLITLNILFALILWTSAEEVKSVDDDITGENSGRLRFLSEMVEDAQASADEAEANGVGPGTVDTTKDKYGKSDLMLVVLLSLWMDLGNIALIAVYACMDSVGEGAEDAGSNNFRKWGFRCA